MRHHKEPCRNHREPIIMQCTIFLHLFSPLNRFSFSFFLSFFFLFCVHFCIFFSIFHIFLKRFLFSWVKKIHTSFLQITWKCNQNSIEFGTKMKYISYQFLRGVDWDRPLILQLDSHVLVSRLHTISK